MMVWSAVTAVGNLSYGSQFIHHHPAYRQELDQTCAYSSWIDSSHPLIRSGLWYVTEISPIWLGLSLHSQICQQSLMMSNSCQWLGRNHLVDLFECYFPELAWSAVSLEWDFCGAAWVYAHSQHLPTPSRYQTNQRGSQTKQSIIAMII